MNSTVTQHFYSEFLGTFALVFIGSAAIITGLTTMEVAIAHGLVLSIMVSAFMRIAAHFNPAVTIGFLFARRITPQMAGLHLVAQILGALVAAYALKGLMPAEVFNAARGGGQSIAPAIGFGSAWVLEAIATFFLMTAIYGTAVDSRGPKIGGFGIGLVIAFDILAIGNWTGASMNPARSFGPAVAYGTFEAQIIYITAPIVGAIIAAQLYERLILKGDAAPAA